MSRPSLRTVAPVVAQVWRDGARQSRLARLLDAVGVLPVGDAEARAAGGLLARTGTADVVDAFVTLAALPGDTILTGDTADLRRLSEAAGRMVTVVSV